MKLPIHYLVKRNWPLADQADAYKFDYKQNAFVPWNTHLYPEVMWLFLREIFVTQKPWHRNDY